MFWNLIYFLLATEVSSLQRILFEHFDGAATIVLLVLSTSLFFDRKVKQTWVASNFVLWAQILAFVRSAVYLSYVNLLLVVRSEVFPNWSEVFAVAAPRSVELYEPWFSANQLSWNWVDDLLVESCLVERNHGFAWRHFERLGEPCNYSECDGEDLHLF